MDGLKLVYLNVRARGEFIRMLLHAANQPFEDVRIDFKEWGPEYKKDTPYGQVPYIVYDGKKYAQSIAIASFIGRKLGFYGKSDVDGLRVEEVMQLVEDVRPFLRDWFLAKEADKKAEMVAKNKDELFPRYFGYLEKLLGENGSKGFFVTDKVSLADIFVYDYLDTAQNIDPKCLESFPALRKMRANVEAVPGIKKYLATRTKSPI